MQESSGIKIPGSLEEIITPQNTALIIYDMQVGITRQIRNGQEVTQRVSRVLADARAAGMRAFFTRHMSLPKELMGAFQCRTAMAWQRTDSMENVKPLFLRDSPAFQIIPELEPRPSEGIVEDHDVGLRGNLSRHRVARLRDPQLHHRRHRSGNRHRSYV